MNWSLDDLNTKLGASSGTIYSYVIKSVEEIDYQFVQHGSGPNFDGGYVTLCTCKHRMRTYLDCESWKGTWVAGFKGLTTGKHRNDLVYLMKVGWAFRSHKDLWYSREIPRATKMAKAVHRNSRGDVFPPKNRKIDAHAPSGYKNPIAGHSHEGNWKKDVCYFSSNGKPAALLVGDPKYTFLWDRPFVYTPRKLTQGQQKWQLDDFLFRLKD